MSRSQKNYAHDVRRLGGGTLRQSDIPDLSAGCIRVLKLLLDYKPHSVAEILEAAEGTEGMRRLRELRGAGHEIIKERCNNGRGFQYRLIPLVEKSDAKPVQRDLFVTTRSRMEDI